MSSLRRRGFGKTALLFEVLMKEPDFLDQRLLGRLRCRHEGLADFWIVPKRSVSEPFSVPPRIVGDLGRNLECLVGLEFNLPCDSKSALCAQRNNWTKPGVTRYTRARRPNSTAAGVAGRISDREPVRRKRK